MKRSGGDNKMGKEREMYLSYLLRLWRVPRQDAIWHASLEDPQTGERRGFASLDEMCAFLQQRTSLIPDGQDEQREDPIHSEQGGN